MKLLRLRRGFFLKKIVFFGLILFFFVGCSDSGSDENDSGSSSDSDKIEVDFEESDQDDFEKSDGDNPEEALFPAQYLEQEVHWRACALNDYTDTGEGECTDVKVPLFWDEPDGETIILRLKRRLAGESAKRQLWFHEGGPGGSSVTDFGPFLESQNTLFPESDLYLMDHRGTGDSEYLGCPSEYYEEDSEWGAALSDKEWGNCILYLEDDYSFDIAAFNVTEAAIDTAFVAELVKEDGKDIFEYGVSYGTYLVHRYAQMFPEQSKGIILDSTVDMGNPTFIGYDELGNKNVEKVFDLCSEDSFCKEKMGEDAKGKAFEIMDKFKDGHCKDAADAIVGDDPSDPAAFLRILVWSLGLSFEGRTMMPAIFYRIDRCSEEDVAVIKNVADRVLRSEQTISNKKLSGVLFNHIAISEMMNGEVVSANEAFLKSEDNLASAYLEYRIIKLLNYWPVYELDQYFGKFIDKTVPALILNGTLDLQTPIEITSTLEEKFNGENQHFIIVPDSNHGVMFKSPVKTDGAPTCGAQIVQSYLKNPLEKPDLSCFDDLKPVDFHGDSATIEYYMSTEDMWEN